MKTVVIYWCEFRGKKSNLLSFLGSKRKVYLDVFEELSKNVRVALVFGSENYLGNLTFKNYHLYQGGEFVKKRGPLKADAVLDRSRGFDFPRKGRLMNAKVLNQIEFKKLAGDKRRVYDMYPDYCPKTFTVNTANDYQKAISSFDPAELVVVKPVFGFKGNDIIIKKASELLDVSVKLPVIVQEFVETKDMFGSNGRHDIRVVVMDGQPVYSVIRQPAQADGYLANVAKGGSVAQVMLEELPHEVLAIAKTVAVDIKNKFANPFYSIDFGYTGDRAYIFEFNNFIGFPLIDRDHNLFVSTLATVLLEKANLEL